MFNNAMAQGMDASPSTLLSILLQRQLRLLATSTKFTLTQGTQSASTILLLLLTLKHRIYFLHIRVLLTATNSRGAEILYA